MHDEIENGASPDEGGAEDRPERRERARNRLYVQPLGTSRRLVLHTNKPSPGTRVAEIDNTGWGSRHYGWLTQMPNGTYVIENVNGSIGMVDQSKAVAAVEFLAFTADNPPPDPAELAAAVKAWRRGAADDGTFMISMETAAEMLGIPVRTYEGIEAGRGFRYPRLIYLAIEAFNRAPSPTTPPPPRP